MADEQDKAAADVPTDPTHTDDLDLEAMGLTDVELSEEEQVALAAASARPARRTAGTPVEAKGHATPKRKRTRVAPEQQRATPVQFVQESAAELKKVVWPTLNQLQQYFVVVLVFVLIMIAIVSALDLGFGALLFRIFG